VKLPGKMTAEDFNKKLFKHGAAILTGADCDMSGAGSKSQLKQFFRFSFGPLPASSFENDVAILKSVLKN
jgi:DNA-binding transcriptional MocR family regulator